MSRCLTFPPPGYAWNGVSGESLLELIEALKVQRQREKAERREKEKKRRKREKKMQREQGEISQKKRGHHRRHKRLRRDEGNGERSENKVKNENAILGIEKSSLSDEPDDPIPDSLYASSDNNQSIQRKRNFRSCIESQNHGSIIEIVFQLQKQTTPEALSIKPDCSTGMVDSAVQKKLEILSVEKQFSSHFGLSDNDIQEFAPPTPRELRYSPQRARLSMNENSEMTLTESLYRELVANWIPPPLQIEHFDVGDQEWLFERKPPISTSAANYEVLRQGNFTPYPQAQYMPQANLYALPYTIPY